LRGGAQAAAVAANTDTYVLVDETEIDYGVLVG